MFAEEAGGLAEVTGQGTDLATVFGVFVAAGMGRESHCRAAAARARATMTRTGNAGLRCWLQAALGKLELGLGRVRAGGRGAGPGIRGPDSGCGAGVAGGPGRGTVAGRPVRRGRHGVGAVVGVGLPRPPADGDGVRGPVPAAGHRRPGPRPVVDDGTGGVPGAAAAVRTGPPRTGHGERQRRARRLTEARVHLREALAGFERLGSAPGAGRATAELWAAGGGAPTDGQNGAGHDRAALADVLTPQELRVTMAPQVAYLQVRRQILVGVPDRRIAEQHLARVPGRAHRHRTVQRTPVPRVGLTEGCRQPDPSAGHSLTKRRRPERCGIRDAVATSMRLPDAAGWRG